MTDDTRMSDPRDQLPRLAPGEREAFLREHSKLPGPRANLELLAVGADVASADQIREWAARSAGDAPPNTPSEFVALVGVVGLGRLVVEGERSELATLRRLAADPRWRIREGVAMALQRIGAADMPALLDIAADWARGNRYEQRAAVAGVAEPPLLRNRPEITRAFDMLDVVTQTVPGAPDARSDPFQVLGKALGDGWSVVVAADPEQGKPRMERWLATGDPVLRRIMRENLTKTRLDRADAEWTAAWRERLGS